MLKPHPGGGGYPHAHLKKSYMSHGLNKGTKTSGGGSGYNSTAQTDKDLAELRLVMKTPIHKVVKTVLHKNIAGKVHRLAKWGFVDYYTAIKMGFVLRVEYFGEGNEIIHTIINKNIM